MKLEQLLLVYSYSKCTVQLFWKKVTDIRLLTVNVGEPVFIFSTHCSIILLMSLSRWCFESHSLFARQALASREQSSFTLPAVHQDSGQRSSSKLSNLFILKTPTVGGDRVFWVHTPNAWNILPTSNRETDDIVTFERLLKNHLFEVLYNFYTSFQVYWAVSFKYLYFWNSLSHNCITLQLLIQAKQKLRHLRYDKPQKRLCTHSPEFL